MYKAVTRKGQMYEEQGIDPETVQEIDTFEQLKARGAVARQIPDFDRDENEAAAFLQRDPSLAQRYSEMYRQDPQTAMEWAVLRYRAGGPGPEAHSADPRVRSGRDLSAPVALPGGNLTGPMDRFDRLDRARDVFHNTFDPGAAIRIMRPGFRVDHPDNE